MSNHSETRPQNDKLTPQAEAGYGRARRNAAGLRAKDG
jgi:hypothetical protein